MVFQIKPLLLVSVLFTLTTAAPISANPYTPPIDARQANQQQRINQGIATGSLTPREVRHLEMQQHRIERAEVAAKADGVLTRGESIRLNHRQNKASRDIFRKKHNRRY
jgi:hypothetical protein